MLIQIIDLGINNLTSVIKAFTESDDLKKIQIIDNRNADTSHEDPNLLILPGLGHFGAASRVLANSSLPEFINEKLSRGSTLVGICLGMQLLASRSEEDGSASGLNLIKGTSVLLPKLEGERVPNVGWQKVINRHQQGWESLSSGKDFYFTHSYHLKAENKADIFTTSPYGSIEITSAVKQGKVIGFQFHPEKSGKAGKQLISEIKEFSS
jgi:glutamine amidotransferase